MKEKTYELRHRGKKSQDDNSNVSISPCFVFCFVFFGSLCSFISGSMKVFTSTTSDRLSLLLSADSA